MSGSERHFLRVVDFDRLQSPKRPRRPTWIKSYVTDLDDAMWRKQSIAVRCFMMEFQKLAATMDNRVPDDATFIGQKLAMRPQSIGKLVKVCVNCEWVCRFCEDVKTSRKNDLEQKIATQGNPPSKSTGRSPVFNQLTTTERGRLRVVGGEDEIDEFDIPF